MKKCSKCKSDKEFSEFYKSKRHKDNCYPSCKQCETDRTLKYYENNRERQLEKKKEYYLENHELMLEKKRKYDIENREEVNRKAKERYHKNIEYARNYYKENKEEMLRKNKEWIKNNKERHRELCNKAMKLFAEKNPHVLSWRRLLYRTLYTFDIKKTGRTVELLGYSPDELKSHMESLFEDGMSWSNHGEWHIDHIFPLSKFNKETPICEVNSLSNLKPMWAIDNLRKGNRI